jgi:hypothetical protein
MRWTSSCQPFRVCFPIGYCCRSPSVTLVFIIKISNQAKDLNYNISLVDDFLAWCRAKIVWFDKCDDQNLYIVRQTVQWPKENRQTMINKTLQKQLKIEQHEPSKKGVTLVLNFVSREWGRDVIVIRTNRMCWCHVALYTYIIKI